MDILLTVLPGALYLIGILAAVLVALASKDTRRRADACKVLHMLLSPRPRQQNRGPRRSDKPEAKAP